MTSRSPRTVTWSTTAYGVGQPSLWLVCMWRSARPSRRTPWMVPGAHRSADRGGRLANRAGMGDGSRTGGDPDEGLDAGLPADGATRALADRTPLPAEGNRDQA